MSAIRIRSALAAAAVAAAPAASLAQAMPSGALQAQEGTWAYVVEPSSLVESHLDQQDFGSADGIDAAFMAGASVHASRTVTGPDLCDPSERGVSDFRVLGMQVFSRDVPFLSGEQESRLIVSQTEQRAVIYLHGDVREWAPGPNYCEDGQMREVAGGRGMLRLEYETTNHFAPLNFMAYPRSWEIDQEGFEAVCDRFKDMMFKAYREAYPRWQTIPVHSPPGPIDTSVLIPIPEGAHDGEKASFEEGTYNLRTAADAVAQTESIRGMTEAVAPVFEKAPRIAQSVRGFAAWAVSEAVGHYAGVSVDNHVSNALQTMKAINEKWSAEPGLNPNVAYGSGPVSLGPETYRGVNADYYTDLVFDMCETEIEVAEEGYAAGHMSWSGGTIQLVGRGVTRGAPAAQATGPVAPAGQMSVAEAMAMAQAMGAPTMPDMAEIEAQLPEGYSLDEQPIHMTGRAGAGPTIGPNLQEWTISYFVEIDGDGEKIAEVWFDPRR